MLSKIVRFTITALVLSTATLCSQESFKVLRNDSTSRQKQAHVWRDDFIKLNLQIPTLSPAEKRWVQTEINDEVSRTGTHTKRALDAMESREYDLYIAKPRVEDIIDFLTLLERQTLSEQTAEVVVWARLGSHLLDSELWQAIESLIQRGIVHDDSFLSLKHTFWAQYILDEIILNYITGNLEK